MADGDVFVASLTKESTGGVEQPAAQLFARLELSLLSLLDYLCHVETLRPATTGSRRNNYIRP